MRSAACLLLVVLIAGCAALLPPSDQVDLVVREAVRTAKAPPAEQKAVLTEAQQAFGGDTSVVNRLRLATLLATLPPPLRDDARAAELLEPIADTNGLSPARFAAFLSTQLAERQRIGREVDRLTKELDRVSKERSALDRDRQERDKREEALRQQLEALRSIERGILEREERMRAKPGVR